MIHVGTCGFAYRDWLGPFYPPKLRSAEMLPFYAARFAAVEIDSSYYGVPERRSIASMDARTPKGFRFSVKAPATVTHRPEPRGRVHEDAARLADALVPLRESGKLACVLAQFPNGFHATIEHEHYLARVVEAFEGIPVVVEFRCREWQSAHALALLREIGAGYCNADMPSYETLLAPSSDATSEIGYVRLHGRNARNWWSGTNVTRYDYEYSAAELMPWCDRIADLEAQSAHTYVFFNNHARGQAARNAQLLDALLEERYGTAAERVLARAPGGVPAQPSLPGMNE